MERPRSHDELAEKLRLEPSPLDEVTRARMERRLLDAVATNHRPAEISSEGRGRRATWFVACGAMAVAAAALFLVLRRPAALPTTAPKAAVAAAATYTRYVADHPTARGDVMVDEVLATGPGERAQVRFGSTTIDLGAEGAMRTAKSDVHDFAEVLLRGAVEVEFHPLRKGQDHLMIDTEAAQVFVVGTAFRVEVTDTGTRVRVHEGRVRVVPTHGGGEHLLLPGDEVFVHADGAPAEAPGAGDTEAEDKETTAAPAPLDLPALFAKAEALQQQNAQAKSRAVLEGILAAPVPRPAKVRAFTLMAESWTSERAFPKADEAYGRAADVGRGTLEGHNAIFARARLRERESHDVAGAKSDYGWYLREAADGPHAALCREALCRLGDPIYCPAAAH